MKIKNLVKRSIAGNIRQARLAAKMTQAEAAEKLGITAQAISNFERGINNIESSMLLRMCEIYNVSMTFIAGDQTENPLTESQQLSEGDKEILEVFRMIPDEWRKVFLEQGRAFANSLKKD